MGKGSGRRPKKISDAELEKAWSAIFAGHPTEDQFEKIKQKPPVVKEDDYGNELPKSNDPDKYVDDLGDA